MCERQHPIQSGIEGDTMAAAESVNALKDRIDVGLKFKESALIERTDWGTITFEGAESDFKRIFDILGHLKLLPLEYLTDQALNQILSSVNDVISVLEKIDAFTIEQANPTGVRDQLASQIHTQSDQFYTNATPWIPFLAYQKGDVAENINALTKSVKNAETLISDAQVDITIKRGEIDKIIVSAREASAGAGAAVFTEDFDKEAKAKESSASKWLVASGFLATATIVFSLVMWVYTEPGLDNSQLIQKLGSKLAILAILFTATMWCGRIYKALMHQTATNRHRALSLQTFQAFSSAASDNQIKDAVLMEATRAIFSNNSTGYLDSKENTGDSGVKIIEVVKSTILDKKQSVGA